MNHCLMSWLSTLSADYFDVTFGKAFSMSRISENQAQFRLLWVTSSWKGSANVVVPK